MEWELELWDRAGSQGLGTWYDPRGAGGEGRSPEVAEAGDATDAEPKGA